MYTRKEKLIKQLTALVTVTLGGTTTFAGLCIWNGNEKFYRDYVMPFTRRLDPETSHGLAVFAMKHCLIKKQLKPDAESLVEGHEAVFHRVRQEKEKQERAIIGVNLGKNKESAMEDVRDYVSGVEKFGAIADYLVINISSPNTPRLRGLHKKAELENLISHVLEARNKLGTANLPPLLVKIAPDLSEDEKKDVASVILKEKCRVDGIIVCNTTTSRPFDLKSQCKDEIGGLSGQPLKDLSTRCIRDFYRLTNGQIPIIGVGGISSGQDAYEKILAGASLVQLYTSFALQGPPVVRRIKRELDEILRSNGYQNVAEAIGKSSQGN
uniref:Dihydroorotate dehydrogenase (quinone), mitochondrial n=1 Tax=Daphnia similis TaxID=35528 RepID=A0A4Y7LQ99_9CRUS|nr:EOG090X08P9 [Daphnia similis]